MNQLVPLPVLIPLAAAIFLAAGNKIFPRWVSDSTSIAATIAGGTVCGVLLQQSAASPLVYWFGAWTPRSGTALGVNFVVDAFSAGLAVFVNLLALAAFVFSVHYFKSVGTLYHVLMLGFVAAMCGFSFSGDLFNLFVFFEMMSVAAFALCGYKNEEPQSQHGALNFAIINSIGGFLVFFGIAMLYSRTGALNMAQIGRSLSGQTDILVVTAFVFILCGFYVKAAAFPFHFWLADAHAVAPTPVCILFSGVMVELGVYAVARVYWGVVDGPFSSHRWALTAVLLAVGALTALLGAVMCFMQRHIKRLLAFSTISHVGLLVIGFALLTPDALAGASIYVVGHGLIKAALFIIAGILLHRFESVDELEIAGRGRELKLVGVVFVLGGLGLAGVPSFATFVAEHAITGVAEQAGHWWIDIVFLATAALTAAAIFRVYARVFLGYGKSRETPSGALVNEERETSAARHRIPFVMYAPPVVLLALAIYIGLQPHLIEASRRAAYEFADHSGYQARVIDNAQLLPKPVAPEHGPILGSVGRSFLGVTAAVLLAAWSLSDDWRRRQAYKRPIRSALKALRQLHSGHVGDYAAFFTFGVAAIGIVLGLLILH
jgi:multicomponent Na+:H+ antiporter subunit D